MLPEEKGEIMRAKLGRYETIKLDADAIKKYIYDKNITQSVLARRMGVSQPALSRWLSKGMARRRILKSMADGLEVDPICLVHEDSIMHEGDKHFDEGVDL